MDQFVEHLEVGLSQIGGEVGMAEQEVKEIRVWMETVTEMNFHMC